MELYHVLLFYGGGGGGGHGTQGECQWRAIRYMNASAVLYKVLSIHRFLKNQVTLSICGIIYVCIIYAVLDLGYQY